MTPAGALPTLLTLLFLATAGFSAPAARTFQVLKIEVAGIKRTSESAVLQEFEIEPGEQVTEEMVQAGVQRLRNTNLFATVKVELRDEVRTETGEDPVTGKVVSLVITERWTTIPIVKFSSGGGVNQTIIGVYDPNLLGRRIEMGAQYERLGQANSGVTWLRHPRLFGERIKLDIQAWRVNRLRTKYVQGPVDPEVLTGFLQTRTRLVLGLDFEVAPWLSLGTFGEYHKDRFSDRYLDEETKEKVAAKGLPPGTEVLQRGLRFGLGRLNNVGWQQEGLLLNVAATNSHSLTGDADDFGTVEGELVGKWQVIREGLIAQRVLVGWTNTEVLQYWYYLGGLDRVRGFVDNRFAGSKYWLSNSELRLPVYRTGPVIFQQVTFYDIAAAAEQTKELRKASGASVGIGLRIIAPSIYRFVARLDFAYNTLRRDEMPVSFGVQQFF